MFHETCVGSAIVSLTLAQGMSARAPVPVMGSKLGYRHAVLAVLGMRPGQGAHRYWLNDSSPWGSFWATRCQDSDNRIADRIEQWQGEDPRELWTRLRDEWRDNGPPADQIEAAAQWALLGWWSFRMGHPESGFNQGAAMGLTAGGIEDDQRWAVQTAAKLARRTRRATLPNAIGTQAKAEDLLHDMPQNMAGWVVYMDPDYQGTTGYADTFPRESVCMLAEEYTRRGAVVAISEAVDLRSDLGRFGWWAVDITDTRRGQKRTNPTREYVTLNRPPAWVPPAQRSLFAVAS